MTAGPNTVETPKLTLLGPATSNSAKAVSGKMHVDTTTLKPRYPAIVFRLNL